MSRACAGPTLDEGAGTRVVNSLLVPRPRRKCSSNYSNADSAYCTLVVPAKLLGWWGSVHGVVLKMPF